MRLYIDTRKREKITISLFEGEKLLCSKTSDSNVSSDTALKLVEKLLNESRVNLSHISKIEVECGPGSYTGTRVGTAIANTLALSLLVPVNEKKYEIAIPNY